ncbi:MAG: ArnT family glycosyltransferase [Rhodospirillales bacterium]
MEPSRTDHRVRVDTYLFFLAAFALVVFLTHAPWLDLPYHWDELGQFVPAALDLFQRGLWVPRSTVPNVHPPGLMAWLAGVWSVFGYSITVTRLAMLALASVSALLAFLLGIRLSRNAPGAPALYAVLLLLISPLFYTQAMLAQLDLPAMLFTLWALLLFLNDRHRGAALACVPLVLMKETGLVVPAVLAAWLFFEGKRREAAWFCLPAAALGAWLAVLWRQTGSPFGNTPFAEYNLLYPLHPVRLLLALLRRVQYLVLENGHWIGWLGIAAAWRSRVFLNRAWRVTGAVAAAHVLAVTVSGGATLERYLMPVMPILYIAMAAGLSSVASQWARVGQAALAGAMLFSLFWNPPFPYPFENNLAVTDFVRLQQTAAGYIEENYPDRVVVTAWPLAGALRRPDLGYVSRPMRVKEIDGFGAAAIAALKPDSVQLLVVYSREWEPAFDLSRIPFLMGAARRFYGYEPQVPPYEIERRFNLREAARWSRRGQWIAVLER